MNQLLTINKLSVTFAHEQGTLRAVREVSLAIGEGETVAVVGESGAGKSQLFHALMGIQANNATVTGNALFKGQELLSQTDKVLNQIRGKDISIIFQDPMSALNPYIKIGTQLTEVLQIHQNFSAREAKVKSIEALAEVKLSQPDRQFDHYPHELSGGMRQRVLIAMALLCKPKLIIADEPTTALDVTVQTEIIHLLRKIHLKYNTSIVLITHDMPLVAGLCDKILIMYAGRIVEVAMIEDIHKKALHPYTQALLKAIPGNAENHTLVSIPGNPTNPADLGINTRGCSFAPRCVFADKKCLTASPDLIEVSTTQSVACIHWDK